MQNFVHQTQFRIIPLKENNYHHYHQDVYPSFLLFTLLNREANHFWPLFPWKCIHFLGVKFDFYLTVIHLPSLIIMMNLFWKKAWAFFPYQIRKHLDGIKEFKKAVNFRPPRITTVLQIRNLLVQVFLPVMRDHCEDWSKVVFKTTLEQSQIKAQGYKTFVHAQLSWEWNMFCQQQQQKNYYQQFELSSCTAELSMKFFLLINIKMQSIVGNCQRKSMKFSLLINIKIPTIVGILILISRRNFMLNWVEYGKMFYYLGPRSYYIGVLLLMC